MEVMHEALHIASGLGDVELALRLNLSTSTIKMDLMKLPGENRTEYASGLIIKFLDNKCK